MRGLISVSDSASARRLIRAALGKHGLNLVDLPKVAGLSQNEAHHLLDEPASHRLAIRQLELALGMPILTTPWAWIRHKLVRELVGVDPIIGKKEVMIGWLTARGVKIPRGFTKDTLISLIVEEGRRSGVWKDEALRLFPIPKRVIRKDAAAQVASRKKRTKIP